MSNHLAIATVTATLQTALSRAAEVVPGAQVVMKRPDGAVAAAAGAGVNIFLYQVTPNAAYRNADLPARRSDGQLVRRPQAALVLHYLLSCFGDEALLEPQRLLGAVIRQLHAWPLLDRKDIAATINPPAAPPPPPPPPPPNPLAAALAKSNLAAQVDTVRFTPLNLSLEELSRVWSVFFQTPYLLSVAYQASAVLIESDDEEPGPALPVETRRVFVVQLRQPVVDRVSSLAADDAPIVSSSTLRITGKRLSAALPVARLDGVERQPKSVSDTEMLLDLPAGLSAGVHALQIVHKPPAAAQPGALHSAFESNVATFVLRPVITDIDKPGPADPPELKVTVDVPIGEKQRVLLLLNGLGASAGKAYAFLAKDPNLAPLKLPISGVDPGEYLVSVQIDGAMSLIDPAPPTPDPRVTLP